MNKITVYTKPNCIYCKQAKEYLTSLGMTYEEIDVMSSSELREQLVASGHKTLPVIYAGDKLMASGYHNLKTMRREDITKRLQNAG